jgi:V/A-type H+-transporting ATPase subunit I
MPSDAFHAVKKRLAAAFGSQVVLAEKEFREEDAERIPVLLRNAPYFKPFELLTRVLPLPHYTSIDPTPFLGIFFPVFFGMILGDAGYGLVLIAAALYLMRRFRRRPPFRDASRILLVSSLYAIFFGVLYGEFFGDLPERHFGLHPLCVERRSAVIPMLYFTLAVGAAHVLLGLGLGVISSLKKHAGKEAAYRLLSILSMVGLFVALAAYFEVLPALLVRPAILAILFLTPFLLFTGGLLAPLELLKSIGNIISYVRIMAIGLTSVLLAFMANTMAGTAGNILIGITVAVLLHLLNIILGIFSPTVHAIRLHYVEFFSKFFEQGGRRFEPLRK